jgi:hypothetical protein
MIIRKNHKSIGGKDGQLEYFAVEDVLMDRT